MTPSFAIPGACNSAFFLSDARFRVRASGRVGAANVTTEIQASEQIVCRSGMKGIVPPRRFNRLGNAAGVLQFSRGIRALHTVRQDLCARFANSNHPSTVYWGVFSHVCRYPLVPCCWTSPIQHGSSHNVLQRRPQSFAARYERLLPVRAPLLPDFDCGPSGERRRRDSFNIGEVAFRPDPTVRRGNRRDDRGIRASLPFRSNSFNAALGQANRRPDPRPSIDCRSGGIARRRIAES